jgi:uncharacterized protein with ParB-like and HNH nuclease domain
MDKQLNALVTQEKNVSMCIRQLFTDFKQIRIPAYQRAYSWEHKQRAQFLDDLLEQNEKQYYLGQLLFEKEGNTYYVIDGQQRLTTIVIFLSALASILTSREENPLHLHETYLSDVFKTIDADQVTFKRVTQKHLVSKIDTTETISERRIIEAFMHFSFELNKHNVASLKQIQTTLENAEVSPFFIYNKIQATQVFEYQNNRGKELSRFEIIKAYLMHQVYIQCANTDQANNDIAEIQSVVATTYRHIEAVEGYFSENELLDNYCNLFFNIDGGFDSIKKQLGTANNKAKWIKDFFENLVDLTQCAKMIVQHKNRSEITSVRLKTIP